MGSRRRHQCRCAAGRPGAPCGPTSCQFGPPWRHPLAKSCRAAPPMREEATIPLFCGNKDVAVDAPAPAAAKRSRLCCQWWSGCAVWSNLKKNQVP